MSLRLLRHHAKLSIQWPASLLETRHGDLRHCDESGGCSYELGTLWVETLVVPCLWRFGVASPGHLCLSLWQSTRENSLRAEGPILAFSSWPYGPLLLGPHVVRQNIAGITGYLVVDRCREWAEEPEDKISLSGVASIVHGHLLPNPIKSWHHQWLVQLPFSKVWCWPLTLSLFGWYFCPTTVPPYSPFPMTWSPCCQQEFWQPHRTEHHPALYLYPGRPHWHTST